MLPQFNRNGYLPRGIHKATLREIKQRFGSGSKKREELFQGLQAFINLLDGHKKAIKSLLVNGSFVTAKEIPGDIDCILVVKNSFDFDSSAAKQLLKAKKLFNIHLFTFLEAEVRHHRGLKNFFGYDQESQPKGFVEVIP